NSKQTWVKTYHKNVIFTSNITESINLALRGILKEHDHVVTSSLEHNAVWRCLKTLEKENKHITLLYAAKNPLCNHALVLNDFLSKL
ncbi:MAG TPA: aminotransferase class V-fold PLP-dependent enzyme, partial [Chitinophagaceae bacterium]|nr:aminotransferase class V-fold PLP-dependent enzyme [Chitinophagaceae bacterium]